MWTVRRGHVRGRTVGAADSIDQMPECYAHWREASATVGKAYRRWSTGPAAEDALSLAAHGAAVDQEESAATVYVIVLEQLEPIREMVER